VPLLLSVPQKSPGERVRRVVARLWLRRAYLLGLAPLPSEFVGERALVVIFFFFFFFWGVFGLGVLFAEGFCSMPLFAFLAQPEPEHDPPWSQFSSRPGPLPRVSQSSAFSFFPRAWVFFWFFFPESDSGVHSALSWGGLARDLS